MMNIAGFLSYVLVANLSPGPNAIISMSNAGKYGLKKSIRFNLGVALGVFLAFLLCSLFSWVIFDVFPAVQSVMVWIGAGYILWLAWNTLKSGTGGGAGDRKEEKNIFLQGIVLQFVNPNVILSGITIFSTFILPQYQSPLVLILFCVFLSVMAFACTACWTLFGTLFQNIILKYGKIINIIMAVLLVYCALSLIQ